MTKDKRSSWIRGDALVGEGWLYLPQEVSCCWGCRGWCMCGLPKNSWVWWWLSPKNGLRLIGLVVLLGVVGGVGGVFWKGKRTVEWCKPLESNETSQNYTKSYTFASNTLTKNWQWISNNLTIWCGFVLFFSPKRAPFSWRFHVCKGSNNVFLQFLRRETFRMRTQMFIEGSQWHNDWSGGSPKNRSCARVGPGL